MARIGLPEQFSWDRKGLSEYEIKVRTGGLGGMRQECWNKAAGIVRYGQDS
jgi:hypothetical protein